MVVDLSIDDSVDVAAIVVQGLAAVGRQVVDGEAAVSETFPPVRIPMESATFTIEL